MLKVKEPALLFLSLLLLCSLIFASGCGRSSAKAAQQLELAVKYLSESKFEEAILAYREVIKIDPKNVLAYKGMSAAYSMQGKMEQAEQALQEGLKKVADNKPLKLSMAGLMVDWGKNDQAEALYKEMIAQDEKYLPVYQAYSKLLVGLGRQAEAVVLLERAVVANREHYKLHSMLADVYFKSGDREKALAALYMSLTIEPNQAASYKLLEDLYTGRWEELTALGEQYLRQKQEVPGQIIKLVALYGLGKYDELVQRYEQMPGEIKANPKVGLVAARTYIKLGKADQGLGVLKDINTASIRDAALLAEIADCYLEAGDKETARKLAVQGVSLEDTAVENYNVLFRSYQQEDNSQADIWQKKFIINSAYSLNQAKKELELIFTEQGKRNDVNIAEDTAPENDKTDEKPLKEESAEKPPAADSTKKRQVAMQDVAVYCIFNDGRLRLSANPVTVQVGQKILVKIAPGSNNYLEYIKPMTTDGGQFWQNFESQAINSTGPSTAKAYAFTPKVAGTYMVQILPNADWQYSVDLKIIVNPGNH